MRVISASLQNFASYETLNFNFLEQGLTLIQGPTGSGKSTLCDAIPWVLFGKTAKGGAVDEVLTWPGDKVVKGAIHLEINNTAFVIKRFRGPKSKDNDLYYMEVGGPVVRGKDLLDTQKQINQIIGIDCELYLAGAYYHEFSQTAQFFTTTAKNRRAICEQLVDLSLAVKLQAQLSEQQKITRKDSERVLEDLKEKQFKIDHLERTQASERNRSEKWKVRQTELISLAEKKADFFEVDKANRILSLESKHNDYIIKMNISTKCPTCGAKKQLNHSPIVESPYQIALEQEKRSENAYIPQLADLMAEENPFADDNNMDYSVEINELNRAVAVLIDMQTSLILKSDDLELLQEITNDYRSLSIMYAIAYIESQTNKLLENHFDSEIKVKFEVESADKLDVTIQKDGNTCVFSQLSKGQRQILKLCFGASVMQAVANHHGVAFNAIFLDEALDGLDEQMKVKAFRMLETMAIGYESIFMVEHSEALKPLFSNSYSVALSNGSSRIEKS